MISTNTASWRASLNPWHPARHMKNFSMRFMDEVRFAVSKTASNIIKSSNGDMIYCKIFYQDQAYRKIVVRWCQDEGIEYTQGS